MKKSSFIAFALVLVCGIASNAQRTGSQVGLKAEDRKPIDLSVVEKTKIAADFFKTRSINRKVTGIVSTLKLTPREGFRDGQGYLSFFKPEAVVNDKNFAYFEGIKGRSVGCFFKPAFKGTYLVDFAVQNEMSLPTNYKIVGIGSNGETELEQSVKLSGIGGHVTVVYDVSTLNSGYRMVSVSADQWWRVYSCEVSRIN